VAGDETRCQFRLTKKCRRIQRVFGDEIQVFHCIVLYVPETAFWNSKIFKNLNELMIEEYFQWLYIDT
jgi:hypothetical protein